ncbi:Sec-independent protein translocase protein TatB [Brevundimonas sp. AAP58]|uniref:Sec-independent protein translocase protein TatB n=1 Tax=Brevundimonas sp. AAP58 TaxID=1523422 RepID=UPI0006B8AE69
MGGLGPGIGGLEILVIGLLALIVVGPKDLPILMRKVGQALGKARAMANEFRASFDEMARQSELDELRKEVDALRRNQMVPLGPEAEAAFRDINQDLSRPLNGPAPGAQPQITGPGEFSDPGVQPLPTLSEPAPTADLAAPAPPTQPRAPSGSKSKAPPAEAGKTPRVRSTATSPTARPRKPRKKVTEQ